ncbi:DUF805 domain-containing protein [Acinetobacter sp. WZC-1]|uniref:DUF805 domain-containing protein n=1 Tax=Acinetobacter sp. WZC-1 TaxID=3459034 RepID=UPI00403D5B92
MSPFDTQTYKDHPFSPKGRFTRLSYLAWYFISVIIYSMALLVILPLIAISFFIPTGQSFPPTAMIALVLVLISVVGFMVATVCITIRRLHDLNKSGWLWLLTLVPFINLIFMIYVCVARGSTEANQYGPFRATEQSEKLLGSIYVIFMALLLVLYVAIMSSYVLFHDQVNQYFTEMSKASMVYGDESSAITDDEDEHQPDSKTF